MPVSTPVYGWPYQTRSDAPNGPDLGGQLALAVEATVQARQNEIAALQATANLLTATSIDFSGSFVLGASVTPPTKGAGTVYTAEYRRVGAWVDYTFSITIGAGFVAGSGTYRIPLPVAAVGNKKQVGPVYVQDFGTALLVGVCVFDSSSDTWLSILTANATGGYLGSGGPGTAWATGDRIQGSITYLAA